jgi:hypothetical protein
MRNDRRLGINSLLDILDLIEFAYKLPFTNIDKLTSRMSLYISYF